MEPHRTEHAQRYDLRSLFETSRVLSSSLDLNFVLSNLLLSAMSKLLVTRGVALMHDPVEKAYRTVSVKGINALSNGELVHVSEGATDTLRTGSRVPRSLFRLGIRLMLSVQFAHRTLGLIGLGAKATGKPFGEVELEFVQSLVNMSAGAVHNCLIVEELQQANRDLDGKIQQLNTLFELSREFNATMERSRLVRLFSFALMGQMLVSRHAFFLKSRDRAEGGERLRVVSAQGLAEATFSEEEIALLGTRTELVLLDESPDASAELASFRARGLTLVLPLLHHHDVTGVLCLGPKGNGMPYQPDDIEFLYSLGNLAVVSLQNADLVEQRIEKERLEEELSMARDIQLRLLPQSLPAIVGLQVATLAVPSREVGGDYVDVIALEDGRILFVIADVTGKSMPAALLMANLQACIHVTAGNAEPIERKVASLNRVIHRNTAPDKFITAFCGLYHPSTRQLQYVNAGHERPFLIRKSGDVIRLGTGGILLGVLPSVSYMRGSIQLDEEDVVVLFTDGITEAMGAAMEEYTEARLEQQVVSVRFRSPQEILDHVQASIESFTGPVNVLSDDRTMVVVKAASAPD